jgi:hypothetical protein
MCFLSLKNNVCQLSDGQLANNLSIVHPQFTYGKYNKVMGIPFTTTELKNTFNQILEEE